MPLHLLYGGTFDPVHHGHLAIARAARDLLQCKVWLLPAADPPHRPPPGASADERLRMLELAVQGESGLHIDRRELARPGPSYTVESLREVRREIGAEAPLGLLLGADSFLSLPTWQDWQALFDLAHLVIAERPNSPLDDGAVPEVLGQAAEKRWTDTAAILHQQPAGRLLRLQQPLHPASASAIRQRLADHAPWAALLPSAVAAYIHCRGLYQRISR